MLRRSMLLSGMCVIGVLALFACGEKQEAKDPSDDKPANKDETPKWEGAVAHAPEDNKTAKSSSGGAVHEAPKRRTDQYDKEGTEIALKRAARQVKENCGAAKDENGKAIGPWGKLTIQVQLLHNGHSKQITVPSPYQGKPAGNCIENAFANLSFSPWSGADTTVDWEVELVEQAKDAKTK